MKSCRIALIGYGMMGKEIERIALERGHIITLRSDEDNPLTKNSLVNADIAIDFSRGSAVQQSVQCCIDARIPLIIGSTGWNAELAALTAMVGESIGVIFASNFSIGMQIYLRLVRAAGVFLDRTEEYDVMVHELHHHRKIDSPSGSALSIAGELLKTIHRKTTLATETQHGRITASELHVSSTRGGEIIGTHTVYADSWSDTIEITHRAKNRSGFALGAVLTAEWLCTSGSKHRGVAEFATYFDEILG